MSVRTGFDFPQAGRAQVPGQRVGDGVALPVSGDARRRRDRSAMRSTRSPNASDHASTLDELYMSLHRIIGTVMPASNFYIAIFDAAGTS